MDLYVHHACKQTKGSTIVCSASRISIGITISAARNALKVQPAYQEATARVLTALQQARAAAAVIVQVEYMSQRVKLKLTPLRSARLFQLTTPARQNAKNALLSDRITIV